MRILALIFIVSLGSNAYGESTFDPYGGFSCITPYDMHRGEGVRFLMGVERDDGTRGMMDKVENRKHSGACLRRPSEQKIIRCVWAGKYARYKAILPLYPIEAVLNNDDEIIYHSLKGVLLVDDSSGGHDKKQLVCRQYL